MTLLCLHNIVSLVTILASDQDCVSRADLTNPWRPVIQIFGSITAFPIYHIITDIKPVREITSV